MQNALQYDKHVKIARILLALSFIGTNTCKALLNNYVYKQCNKPSLSEQVPKAPIIGIVGTDIACISV